MTAPDKGKDDYFGSAVAISGGTIVVGASGEDSDATGVNGDQSNNRTNDSGAAYVFTRAGGGWAQQAYLKGSTPSNHGSSFGGAIAISGDTVVIGAYQEGEWARGVNGDITADATDTDYWRGSSSGAAFLFQRNGVSWVQTAYLKPSNTREEFYFGNSVALSGNLVVIGAYSESGGSRGVNGNQSDQSLEKSGASYIFTLDAPLKPEIVVQQPLGSNVLDNGLGRIFGTAKIKGKGKSRTFTIQNTGTETLAGLTITKDGSHNQDFIISAPVMTSLAPGASTTFKVTFKPKAKGNRTAAVHITSNDANENRFDIKLKGLGAAR